MPIHACIHNSMKKTAVCVSEVSVNHYDIDGQTMLEIDFFLFNRYINIFECNLF